MLSELRKQIPGLDVEMSTWKQPENHHKKKKHFASYLSGVLSVVIFCQNKELLKLNNVWFLHVFHSKMLLAFTDQPLGV